MPFAENEHTEFKKFGIDYRFDMLSNGFLIAFYRPGNHVGSDEGGGTKGGIIGGIKGGTNRSTKGILLNGAFMKLPDWQKDVLLLIAGDNRISISSVAQKLGIARSAAQKHFEALKSKNIIKRSTEADYDSSDKRGEHWIIMIDIEKLKI
ncbi:MAG: winged helix-turn-helix domain-containing protein [Bacteroidales bacterium]